jgi:short-subunit dehydrogenase
MRTFQLALVTGASSGIGEALCDLLASKGIDLIIHGRDEERLKIVADRLRAKVKVSLCIGDLVNIDQRNELIRYIRERKPDLVINNAGFGLYGRAINIDFHEQLSMIDLNIGALTEITLEAGKMMVSKRHQGVIVNIASAAAYFSFPYFATYAATKAFVKNFSEALDVEMKPFGIRVLVSCPGQVDTRFRETASKGKSKSERDFKVMSSVFVSEKIWDQVQKGKSVQIIDWKYRLGLFLLNFIPKRLAFSILSSSIRSRK